MGGKSSDSKGFNWSIGNEQTSPWSVQTPYLEQAFKGAQDAYDKNMASGPYQGDYVAQGDQKNIDAYNQAYNFGTDKTNNGYVQNMMDKANGWVNSGTDWMNKGAAGLNKLSGDQTQYILNNASKFADNGYIGAAVKAAMLDANRNAAENDVPNLYRAAAGANALNSDRAALAQGVVDRGLAERALATSANMRYDAWNKGIDTTQNELNARRQGYGALAQLGQGTAQMGVGGLEAGINDQSRLNQMSAAGAEGLRSLRQNALDNAMAKWQGQQNFPWAALNNFYNIIGSRSWGGNRSWSTLGGEEKHTTETPSVASQIGGGLGAIGSLFSGGADSAAKGLFSFL